MPRKNILTLIISLAVGGLGVFGFSAPARAVANPNANQEVKDVLNYLYALPGKTENKVISGQAFGKKWQYDANVVELYRQTGLWPGLLTSDYYHDYWEYPVCIDCAKRFEYINFVNSNVIDYWNKGGMVSLSGHMINPKNVTAMWDTSINLSEVLTPGNQTYNNWIKYLDTIAVGLKELEDAGVVVLYRPLHEMHGSWFWWGGRDANQYKALWKQLFDYLTYTKSVNNLLWVYSPSRPASGQFFKYYPGDEYVDIIANDVYTCSPETDTVAIINYQEMKTKNKPLAFGEIGPCPASGRSETDAPWDYTKFNQAFKNKYPDITYFTAWASYWSIVENLNAKQFLEDPWIINRGEINLNDKSLPMPPVSLVTKKVIQSGDYWKYRKGTSNPPSNWKDVSFDDYAWLSGTFPIGSIGYDYGTVLDDNINSYLSFYSRKNFDIANKNNITTAKIKVGYDDGFVAYLNGMEILRKNMPTGTLNYDTSASLGRDINPIEEYDLFPHIGNFIEGNNVLAIELHNKSLSSADMGITLELEITSSVSSDLTPSADVNSDGKVNIKDIQACIKVITGSNMTYEDQCSILAPPTDRTNIKDIQVIIRKIIR